MVEDEITWSIGNGDKVKIWSDMWIPNPDTYKVLAPINPLMHNEKVSALINKERAVWNSKLVNSIFLPYEASAILAIPLSSTLPEDRKVWSGTANGVFLVRSAIMSATNNCPRSMLGNAQITIGWSHYGKQFGNSTAQTKLKTLFGEHVKTSSQLKLSLETARLQWKWSVTCMKAWK